MLTAGGTYVADLEHPLLDGCAHLHFVRSTHRHARIAADVATRDRRAGVVAVFTGADIDVDRCLYCRAFIPLSPRCSRRSCATSASPWPSSSPTLRRGRRTRPSWSWSSRRLPRAAVFDHLDDDVAEAYAAGDDAEGLFDGCDVVVSLRSRWRLPSRPAGRAGVGPRGWKLAQRAGAPRRRWGAGGWAGTDDGGDRSTSAGVGPKFGNYPEDAVTAWVAPHRALPAGPRPAARAWSLHHGRADPDRHLGGTRRRPARTTSTSSRTPVPTRASAYPRGDAADDDGRVRDPARAGTAQRGCRRRHRVGVPGERPPEATVAIERARRLRGERRMDPIDLRRQPGRRRPSRSPHWLAPCTTPTTRPPTRS
jgi:hypothetical protein